MYNDTFKRYKSIIDKELDEIYNNGPILLKDPINHIVSGGKRLRPLLCMLTTKSFKGDEEKSKRCAISIELLHIFSLVHDDIMDNDNLRHGKKTIHNKWNIPIGILAGDAILALAFNRLNKLDNLIKEKFNSALIAVCEGQALDIEFESKQNISIDDYMKMIELKTAHMIGLCAELGAIVSDVNKKTILNMKKFGLIIGKAFQIQDDLLEATSKSSVMGKSLDSDILLNKKTYVMIKANEQASEKIDKIFKKHMNNPHKIKFEFQRLIEDEGIVYNTSKYIETLLKNAEELINGLDIKESYLLNFIKFIKGRKC